ncbi:lysylphosphatidylglycerol synthase transmembrane domain-containing protein [Companilactobacillus mishanensis]|uniref:Phosphatidylglycerol lysyltransferase n=1 Tax=Companilactobacillus mishanensis TaxID=2486008 RepID=A0A5P0ZKH0_9LACO|nr:lysylphosphatidylglycerol synthase transmembrane domain-containing protein [Companilactobacillus mishanensis]MQS46108.1 flippase-like domain-containing protein [Companilactobacillus mishanensis]MQS53600.1 flippase-like domain-containing protein [Companilactobacillus mishanensis]MQS90348.1 flippase-like domain-containing protein [Companilactobacillus mishanensis]
MSRKNIFALLVMLGLVGLIFWWEARKINFESLVTTFKGLNFFWLFVAFASMLLSYAVEAWVLHTLLKKKEDRKFGWWEMYRIPLIQALFNAITPFSSGGQPAQLVGLMQSKIDGGRASSVLLMKFVIYQGMVLINFIIAMIVSFQRVAQHFAGLAWMIVFGLVIHVVTISFLLMIMYYYNFTKKMVQVVLKPVLFFLKEEKRDKILKSSMQSIDSFYNESLVLKKEKKKVIKASILTIIQLFLYYFVVYFVLLALNVDHVNILDVLVMQIMIVMIVSIFPVPGGTGGAEVSFKTLFAGFIPSASGLILAMFLWRFITYLFGMFLGIFAVSKKPKVK